MTKKPISIKKPVSIEIKIDASLVESCIASALENRQYGVGYWADTKSSHIGYGCVREREASGRSLQKPGPWYILDDEAIRRGLMLMATESPGVFARFFRRETDAPTGDVLIQLAVLGEVRYG